MNCFLMRFKAVFLFTYSSIPALMKRVLLSTKNFWISLVGETFGERVARSVQIT